MFVRSSLAISLLALTACSGDDGGGTGTPDGPRQDAQVTTVTEVNCTGATVAASFMTLASSFMPTAATINRGDVVKFDTGADHPVIPSRDGMMTDPGIVVGPSKTKCLKFSASGTFKFECMTHQYKGTLTVN